jgi:HTH-type transcriptional regulator/antitoxin HipB
MIVRSQKQLGELIRSTRKKRGWRQVDLARRASMGQPLISELETGTSSSRIDTILKVLAALDLDLTLASRSPALFDPTKY